MRLYKNFFQLVIKLEKKERTGGQIKRKYGRAKTPYRQLIESNQISEPEKEALTAIYHSLNPAELKRSIDKKLDNLYQTIGQREVELSWLKKKFRLELPREINFGE